MVGRTALQHKASVAISAIDEPLFVDFQPDTWMAQRRATSDISSAVAENAAGIGKGCFGNLSHDFVNSVTLPHFKAR